MAVNTHSYYLIIHFTGVTVHCYILLWLLNYSCLRTRLSYITVVIHALWTKHHLKPVITHCGLAVREQDLTNVFSEGQ